MKDPRTRNLRTNNQVGAKSAARILIQTPRASFPYGGVPANTVIYFDSRLPAYSLGNLRAGIRTNRWELAAYLNNIWDTNARLALDYERGRSARVGYITNQPETVGIYGQYRF
jgi:hypothetical protein